MMLRSWRLYSWMRLIWMSNIADGSSLMPMRLWHQLGELDLVGALDRSEFLLEIRLVGEGIERLQRLGIVHELVADRVADQGQRAPDCTASASGAG